MDSLPTKMVPAWGKGKQTRTRTKAAVKKHKESTVATSDAASSRWLCPTVKDVDDDDIKDIKLIPSLIFYTKSCCHLIYFIHCLNVYCSWYFVHSLSISYSLFFIQWLTFTVSSLNIQIMSIYSTRRLTTMPVALGESLVINILNVTMVLARSWPSQRKCSQA